ncbi:sporulation integral membrane protein YtvI [Pontibacillus yanchengensis]|uniref:Sporulation integral membrane protein YtvI n=2 Tax=Pontibacillus yanchengensis TaxID=462910 RepID=A0ACC7VGA0_9BACI|nr:sporulation integral membrane protein YtvI [Pontibacillus yanchengensis]MYL34143.1 sporulation integral membrane protein YtvI [Pontibacillus yanchengensis]MYL53236.1 sporulation integral membrane protein YtvI [Pontibacillus yanchengensis]
MDQFWLNFWRIARFLYVACIIVFGLFIIVQFTQYTYPFLIAIAIAFIMNPLVNILETKGRMPRPVAVFLSILVILGIIIGIITLLIVELVNGTLYLSERIPEDFATLVNYFEDLIASQIIPIYERLTSMLSTLDPNHQKEIMKQIENVGGNIAASGANLLESILKWLPEKLSQIPDFATVLVFSLLGTFFISKDWYRWGNKIKSLTPDKIMSSSGNVFRGLQNALFGFMKAQFTLISITAIIVLIGLLILQVDYAITIAIITGVVDLLPYLGTGLIFVPWIIFMFFTGNYFLTIGLSILYIVVIIQRQMMEPKVLSTNIGLDPLATLISLFVGYQLFSFLGLIIGPVFLVIVKTLFQTGVLQEIWNFIMVPKHK